AVDASSQVMSFKRYKVNCIAHVGTITPTTITLLRDLRKLGLNVPVFGTWGAMLGETMNEIGEPAKQLYSVHATSPWYDKGPGMDFMRKITLKYHPGTEKPYRGTIYTHGWICNVMLVEGLKRAGRNLTEDALISALEGIKNYDTGGLCGLITYSSTSHKGGDSWKIYKADPVNRKYVPLTEWRTPE
ncbi:MAG: ABC transporter substrate-binding protein, partial [Thermodesulfobacteriota bacterium]|nr:ABC transporter substrate-binding protein [Thermodesulfobacteriota bacterium]